MIILIGFFIDTDMLFIKIIAHEKVSILESTSQDSVFTAFPVWEQYKTRVTWRFLSLALCCASCNIPNQHLPCRKEVEPLWWADTSGSCICPIFLHYSPEYAESPPYSTPFSALKRKTLNAFFGQSRSFSHPKPYIQNNRRDEIYNPVPFEICWKPVMVGNCLS